MKSVWKKKIGNQYHNTVQKSHTQTRPFKPTAISKESFLPSASRTGHVGELSITFQDLPSQLVHKAEHLPVPRSMNQRKH
jgi:hypothetical protein